MKAQFEKLQGPGLEITYFNVLPGQSAEGVTKHHEAPELRNGNQFVNTSGNASPLAKLLQTPVDQQK
jgi:hypothetical protein